MRTIIALTFAAHAFFIGCQTPAPPPPVPPAPPDASDAAPGPQWDACTATYNHLVSVGCVPAVADASTWIAACQSDRGHSLFDLGCLNNAPSPAVVKSCGLKCK